MARAQPVKGPRGAGKKTGLWPDLSLYLMRSKFLILIVFLVILGLGVWLMPTATKQYEARALLQVSSAENTAPNQQNIGAEMALFMSESVRSAALSRFPIARIYPEIEAKRQSLVANGTEQSRAQSAAELATSRVYSESIRSVQQGQKGYISVSFRHPDRTLAAEVLNSHIGAYLSARSQAKEAQVSVEPRPLPQTSESAKTQLLKNEEVMRRFLEDNNIGDFEGEQATALALFQTLSGELLITESKISAIEAQIRSLRGQRAQTPATIEIFRENTTPQTLLDLKLQREDMLARYRPTSEAIELIDRRIAQVEAYLSDNRSLSSRVQTGPNPVFLSIDALLIEQQTELVSYQKQRDELTARRAPILDRLEELRALAPEWQALKRAQNTLTQSVAGRGSDAAIGQLVNPELTSAPVTVRVVEAVSVVEANYGRSWPLYIGLVFIAALAGLIAGLARAHFYKGLAGPLRLTHETGLPVIATVGRH